MADGSHIRGSPSAVVAYEKLATSGLSPVVQNHESRPPAIQRLIEPLETHPLSVEPDAAPRGEPPRIEFVVQILPLPVVGPSRKHGDPGTQVSETARFCSPLVRDTQPDNQEREHEHRYPGHHQDFDKRQPRAMRARRSRPTPSPCFRCVLEHSRSPDARRAPRSGHRTRSRGGNPIRAKSQKFCDRAQRCSEMACGRSAARPPQNAG